MSVGHLGKWTQNRQWLW